jgi:hypothetical protein
LCRYALVRNACTKVVHHYVCEGLGQSVKKSNVLSHEQEQLILASDGASLTHPCGLNICMGHFMCQNFFSHGQNKLKSTNAIQFQLHVNGKGNEYLRLVITYHLFLLLSSLFKCLIVVLIIIAVEILMLWIFGFFRYILRLSQNTEI